MKTIKKIASRCLAPLTMTLLFVTVAHAQSAGIQNPLNSASSDIPKFIASALKALVIIALPVISLFVVVSGFMFVFARGNEAGLTKAKKNFLYVVIGALLILGAAALSALVGSTITQIVKPPV